MTDQLVATRLPKEMLRDLGFVESVDGSDRSTAVRRLLTRAMKAWKSERYATEYARGVLGVAQAATGAGVPIWEMMEYLRARKVPAQYGLDEWEASLMGDGYGEGRATVKPAPGLR